MDSLIVAYSSNKKKQRHFFDGLVRTAQTWVTYHGPARTPLSVRLVPFDPDDPASLDQFLPPHPGAAPALHAVIHKRTDDMAAAVADADPDAARRIAALDHLLNGRIGPDPRHRANLLSIDPLEGVWLLVDRRKIAQAIDRALGKPLAPHKDRRLHTRNVTALSWVHISLRNGPNPIRDALHGKLNFPIIMKRRLACGTKPSHEMAVAYTMEGAIAAAKDIFGADHPASPCSLTDTPRQNPDASDSFASDIIAQEFIPNHGGVLFKVYAIGSNVTVQARPSMEATDHHPESGYCHFDSQKLNRGETFSFDPVTGCSKATAAVMPSRKLAAAIASDLSKELGLSLIGVDVIYDTLTNNYHVVDINYFPGYKGVGKAYEWTLQHICNLVLE